MVKLLKFIGLNIVISKRLNTLKITNKKKLKTIAPYNLLKTMRAGVLVLGPLLAKYKVAKDAKASKNINLKFLLFI